MVTKKKRRVVFLLEDDRLNATVFTHWLQKNGYKVVVAQSVKEARVRLDRMKPPDLFWLDYYLKGDKTGLDFLRMIQRDPRFQDIPTIFVSITVNVQKLKAFKKFGRGIF